ncbi:hypothetical protein F5884DRAFT_681619 [Xylogone sp. PMI_703]|nr:hypothetical protein F5884DRAFT_681619 [Xylogone sp. PMI_703]
MAAALEGRDIRSASLPFKRDKDHSQKWVYGTRPSAGVWKNPCPPLNDSWDGLIGGSESQRAKVRPTKQSQLLVANTYHYRSHHNEKRIYGPMRTGRWADAKVDAREQDGSALSNSLLDLLPQYTSASSRSVQTAILARGESDASIFYSYENKVASPGPSGRQVDLGSLVELAEKKWVNEQTEKIVHGEYEVLDNEGETTVLSRGKGKKSPRQRAAKGAPAKTDDVIEVDGFELI